MEKLSDPVLIAVFGGVLFLATAVHHISEIVSIGLVGQPIIAWALDGGLAVGVCYAGWRLRKAEFSAVEYQTILSWTVAGAFAGGVLIGLTFLIRVSEGRTLAEPVFPLLLVINGGALMATIGGYYAGKSMSTARKFEEIFDNTYQFTGLLAQDGTIIEANDTALSFGGLERGDVVGKKLWNSYWMDPYEKSQEVTKQAVTEVKKNLFKEQIRIQGEVGSAIIDFSVRPIRDQSGEATRLIVEGRDITTIQRQQEHLTALNRYLRHNLRNDLNKIQGYAALPLDQLSRENYANNMEIIHQTATELSDSAEVVREFTEVASSDESNKSECKLGPVVEEACDRSSIPMSQIEFDMQSEHSVSVTDQIQLVFEEFLNAIGTHIEASSEMIISQTVCYDRIDLEIVCSGFEIPSIELSAFDRAGERSSTYHPGEIRFWLMRSIVRGCEGNVSYSEESGGETRIVLSFKRSGEDNYKQFESAV